MTFLELKRWADFENPKTLPFQKSLFFSKLRPWWSAKQHHRTYATLKHRSPQQAYGQLGPLGMTGKTSQPREPTCANPRMSRLAPCKKKHYKHISFPANYPKSILVDIFRALFNLGSDLRFAACCDIGREVGVIGIPVHSVKR